MPLGRHLTADEINAYDHVPADLARRVRVIRIPMIPGGFTAMTLGTWVLVAIPVPADSPSTLMAHELVHVRQWNDLGKRRFTTRYLTSFMSALRAQRAWKAAYWLIDAECEARAETDQWCHRRAHTSAPGG